MILETLEDFQKDVKSGKKINVETKTIFFVDDDEEEKKKETFKVGEPYYINGEVVGVISAMTFVDDKVYVQVTALEDLCNGVNWYEACDKCKDLPNGFRLPTKLDICLWAANAEKINEMLETAGGEPFEEDSSCWSSSEYNGYIAWVFCTDPGAGWGGVYISNKDNGSYRHVVRPVLAFTLSI